jgi:6,7-dimethyl-8-ribityllumazine synthase
MADAPHILIVDARFYDDIADEMTKGAVVEIEASGASFERITVPGAFEIPAAIGFALDGGAYDGFVALGCVIRGETSHYDYVCGESARGLADLAGTRGAAIGYGILTVENTDQAWARAHTNQKNKGASAARACLEMIALKRRFGAPAR